MLLVFLMKFFRTMKSSDFLYLKATPNYSRRTFTIRKYYRDGTITKVRTGQFSQTEFNDLLLNDEMDWQFWLSNVDYYTIVK